MRSFVVVLLFFVGLVRGKFFICSIKSCKKFVVWRNNEGVRDFVCLNTLVTCIGWFSKRFKTRVCFQLSNILINYLMKSVFFYEKENKLFKYILVDCLIHFNYYVYVFNIYFWYCEKIKSNFFLNMIIKFSTPF